MPEAPQLEIPFRPAVAAPHAFRGLPWEEARERAKPARCPECGHPTNTYHRRISRGMAVKLLRLYQVAREARAEWVHVSEFDLEGGRGECGILAHWGLVLERANSDLAKKTSGWWKISPDGIDFVSGRTRLPRYAVVRARNDLAGFSGPETSFAECMAKDAAFHYQRLFKEPLPEIARTVR